MKLLSAFVLALGLFVFQSPLSTADARETFPACTSEKVLKKLVKRFNQTEKVY